MIFGGAGIVFDLCGIGGLGLDVRGIIPPWGICCAGCRAADNCDAGVDGRADSTGSCEAVTTPSHASEEVSGPKMNEILGSASYLLASDLAIETRCSSLRSSNKH